jgi:hypothetical protein
MFRRQVKRHVKIMRAVLFASLSLALMLGFAFNGAEASA